MNKNFNYIINNMVKMLDIYFNHLMPLEIEGKKGSKEYIYYLKKLNIYKTKEKRLTEGKIFVVASGAIDMYIPQSLTNEAKELIIKRFNNIVEKGEEEEILDMADDDILFEEVNTLNILSDIKLDYLRHISKKRRDRLIYQKYKMAFTDISLEDELTMFMFNPENAFTDNSLNARLLDMDEDEYTENKEELIFELTEEILTNMPDDKINVQNSLEYFAYLFNNLNEDNKATTKDAILYEFEDILCNDYDERSIYDIVCDIIGIKKYTNIQKIDEPASSYLMGVINIEKKIYDIVKDLEGQETSELFSKLYLALKEEEDIVNSLNFLDITFEDIISFISDMPYSEKLNAILARLENLFEEENDEYYLGKGEIDDDFENKFIIKLDEESKNDDNLKELKYFLIYTSPKLMQKYLLTKGNFLAFSYSDDKMSAYFSNIDFEEYVLDKEELMINMIESVCALMDEDDEKMKKKMNGLYQIMIETAEEMFNETSDYPIIIEIDGKRFTKRK